MPRSLHVALAACALVACGETPPPTTPTPEATGTCAILAINDTYRIEPSPDGTGGMARIRTLRARLLDRYPDLVMMHAGDFLSPSLLSRQYQGAQMIDVLNHLDGSDAFDPRLLVTFGNHEFDDDRASVLSDRLRESAFRWVSSNIEFAKTDSGQPRVDTDKVAGDVVLSCGGFNLGVFGLTTDVKPSPYVQRYKDPIETARAR